MEDKLEEQQIEKIAKIISKGCTGCDEVGCDDYSTPCKRDIKIAQQILSAIQPMIEWPEKNE
jgi:hypothetical protein